jgi:hypothetical protein
MLQRATAASRKGLAKRRDSVSRWRENAEQTADRIIPGDFDKFDLHAFPRKSVVNENLMPVNLADSLAFRRKRGNLKRMVAVFYQGHREQGIGHWNGGVVEWWGGGVMGGGVLECWRRS